MWEARRWSLAVLITVVVAASVLVILTVPDLYVIKYGPDIGINSGGGEEAVQVFNLHAGTEFSISLQDYPTNGTASIVFSVRAPDGRFLLNTSITAHPTHGPYSVIYSYTFTAGQSGPYALTFSSPRLAAGLNAVANMTVYEPILGQYQPDACSAQFALSQQIPSLPAEMCTS